MTKPIYEIPLTDPAAPPFGLPGTAGIMPPQRGVLPPDPGLAATDFSQLPPPGAPGVPSGTPGMTMPAPNQAEAVFGTAPANPAAPSVPTLPGGGMPPGYQPAPPAAGVLPIPSTDERSRLGVVPAPVAPEFVVVPN